MVCQNYLHIATGKINHKFGNGHSRNSCFMDTHFWTSCPAIVACKQNPFSDWVRRAISRRTYKGTQNNREKGDTFFPFCSYNYIKQKNTSWRSLYGLGLAQQYWPASGSDSFWSRLRGNLLHHLEVHWNKIRRMPKNLLHLWLSMHHK